MSNLLKKASIIHVPAGYDVGSINAVKPNLDLSEELIVNGDFSTNSNWFLGAGWNISNGKATSTIGNNNQTLRKTENIGVNGGKTYRVKFDVLDYVGGSFRLFLGDNADPASKVVEGITANGSYTYDFTPPFGTSGLIIFRNLGTDTSFSIDNVSVKEILPADLYFDRGTSATQTRNASDGDIESVGVDIPRIDYQGGVGHWLIEPETTNFSTYSNDLTQSFYTKEKGGVGVLPIVTANYSTSPDGTQNASRLQCDLNGGNTSSDYSYIYNVGAASSNDGNVSVYLKNNESGSKVVYFRNTFGTIDNVTVTESWQRFNISNADTRGLYLGLRGSQGNSDTCDISVYGIQIEDNTFATSLIPTSGSTVTRDTEVASGSGDSTMFNDSEGVLYLETASLVSLDSNFRTISICDGTNDDTLRIRYSTIENRIDVLTRSGGVTKVDMNHPVTDITDFHKIAFKYKSGDSALWVDGVERATSTVTFTHSGLNELKLSQGDANAPFYGKIKCIAVFKEALTDSELQCLTS